MDTLDELGIRRAGKSSNNQRSSGGVIFQRRQSPTANNLGIRQVDYLRRAPPTNTQTSNNQAGKYQGNNGGKTPKKSSNSVFSQEERRKSFARRTYGEMAIDDHDIMNQELFRRRMGEVQNVYRSGDKDKAMKVMNFAKARIYTVLHNNAIGSRKLTESERVTLRYNYKLVAGLQAQLQHSGVGLRQSPYGFRIFGKGQIGDRLFG